MTRLRAGVVDVCVLRRSGKAWKVLLLRRAASTRTAGSWEIVHGRIERGEKPAAAARRELLEETGFAAETLYSVAVNPFYLLKSDTVQLAIVFAAEVRRSRVTLGEEHDNAKWVSVAVAARALTWPRDVEAVRAAVRLLANRRVIESTLRA
ncbi:MAG: NUDIX domain-containing protein [Gemmatimonadales bacterium]